MPLETNVGDDMLFQMSSGKYQSFLKILKYFTFSEFHEQFIFRSTDPPAFKFPRLFLWLNCCDYVEEHTIYRIKIDQIVFELSICKPLFSRITSACAADLKNEWPQTCLQMAIVIVDSPEPRCNSFFGLSRQIPVIWLILMSQSDVSSIFQYYLMSSPPHIFVTNPGKILGFSIPVTSPPRDTVFHLD